MRYLIEEAFIPFLVFLSLMTLIVGLGVMINKAENRSHEIKLACLHSGGTLVSGNCLRAHDSLAVK